MAGITIEGKLWIDLADVYALFESKKACAGHPAGVRFDIDCDALVLMLDDKYEVEIDAAQFWTWVIDRHLPNGIAGFETVFGVPKVEGQDLVVSFAAGNEGDPRNWGVPPVCLAEWKQSAAVSA